MVTPALTGTLSLEQENKKIQGYWGLSAIIWSFYRIDPVMGKFKVYDHQELSGAVV